MSNKCPKCKKPLLTEHSFCPNCGVDLRQFTTKTEGVKRQNTSGPTYLKTTIIGLTLTILVYALYTVVKTRGGFDMTIYTFNVIGYGFGTIVIAIIASSFYKQNNRRNAYMNWMIGIIILTAGFRLLGALYGSLPFWSITNNHSKIITTQSGLKYEILKEGDGPLIKKGYEVKTHCLLTLKNGEKIWSTQDDNRTFDFIYGETSLISGFNEMISLMKVGDKVRVTIPPELGYGTHGAGNDIPPNATLIFEIEVIEMN